DGLCIDIIRFGGCTGLFYDPTWRVSFDPPPMWSPGGCIYPGCIGTWWDPPGLTWILLFGHPFHPMGLEGQVLDWMALNPADILVSVRWVPFEYGIGYLLEWWVPDPFDPSLDLWRVELWANSSVGHVGFSGQYFIVDELFVRPAIFLSMSTLCLD
ncbi:unnamed protein product, partial [marine sediment metagenome]